MSTTIMYLFILLLLLIFLSVLVYHFKHYDVKVSEEIPKKQVLSVGVFAFVYLFTFLIYVLALLDRFFSMLILCLGLFTLLVSSMSSKRYYFNHLLGITALFLSFAVSFYIFYPPSLGNDTWRDIVLAMSIEKGIKGFVHAAYPIPLIPILYLSLSMIIGVSPVEASVLAGLTYIVLIVITILLITRALDSPIPSPYLQ